MYWPWGQVIEWIVRFVTEQAPVNGTVLDYMSGTGYLIESILSKRPDISAIGCDDSIAFDSYARRKALPNARFVLQNALEFQPENKPDLILVTGGLHHLTFSQHPLFLAKIASELGARGTAIIAEESIGPHRNERERKLAALEHGDALVRLGIEMDWPSPLIAAALSVLRSDVLLNGEYKRGTEDWASLISQHFAIIEMQRLWTTNSGGGDVVFVCKARIE